tara:strand:- start:2205 stop:2378 length:174 start_codon:yes stop_codon:yes gene_type:complete
MRPKTVKCPRCNKRHNFRKLRKFAEEGDIEVARVVRTQMLSERMGTAKNEENLQEEE